MDNNGKRISHGGFTLIEVVVATALITIVLGGLWAGVSFSGKSTKNSVLQSDALNSADSTFRKLKIFLAACDKIEFPIADMSSEYAVLADPLGDKWVLSLADGKRTVAVSSVKTNDTYKLFSTKQTLLKFTAIDFHNLGGKELKVTVNLNNINGDKVEALTSFVSVFKVGQ